MGYALLELLEHYEEIRKLVEAGDGGALVTVIGARGSTPRHGGASMVVCASGDCIGTIGGGRVEMEVIREAIALVRAGERWRGLSYHLTRDLAMCCGGTMRFSINTLGPEILEPLRLAKLALGERERGQLELLGDGTWEFAQVAGRNPGAIARLNVWPGERAVLFGCGHVSRALGPVLKGLGFELAVCDDGETDALENPPEYCDRLIDSFDPKDVESALGGFGPTDYLLILTRDHAIDQKILESLLPRSELAYLGMIGSLGKRGRIEKRLAAKGIGSKEDWKRLRSPIGYDVGAETPAEIAISVAAELVAVRAKRREGQGGE